MLVSMQIIVYLFIGGASGGMLALACLWSLHFRRTPINTMRRARLAFDAFFSRCVVMGALGMFASILCLFWDLGRPDRVFALIFTSTPNILTLGALCLGAGLAISAILSSIVTLRISALARFRDACEVFCVVLSLVVILYTGAYLYSMEAVAFWHTIALIAVFFFSSLSTGLSLMLLIAYFTHDQMQLLGAVASMQKMHLACIACETVAIGLFVWSAATNPAASASLSALLSDAMLPTAVIGVCGMALAVPFLMESYALASGGQRSIPASDIICLVGGLILRYCVVACGFH